MNSVISNYRRYLELIQTAAIIIGDGDRKRTISSLEVVPIFWDNFSYLKTNCAIMCGARAFGFDEAGSA